MKNRKNIHFTIFYGLLVLAVSTMPFTKFLFLPIILLLFLNFVIEWNWKEKIERVKNNSFVGIILLFLSLYLIYLIGFIHSANIRTAFSSLDCKMFFFVAPLVIFTADNQKFTKYRMHTLWYLFIFSNLLLVFTNLTISTIHFIQHGAFYHFFYLYLSHFMHPSYSAMYITVALALSIYFLFFTHQEKNRYVRFILWLSIPFFIVYIFLLQSKAGLLTFGFLILVFIIYLLNYQKKSLYKTIFFMLIFGGISYLSIFKISSPNNRIRQSIEVFLDEKSDIRSSKDGTLNRMVVWNVSYRLGIAHFPFGVGTGDVQDVLNEAYQQSNFTTVYDKKMNPHNQYLQTFLALGVAGIIILLAYLFVPLVHAIKKKNLPYIVFLLAVILNLLVESMLETRAGTNFIALFNCLFYFMVKIPETPTPSPNQIES